MVIDTHIHLFRSQDIPNLAWQTPTGPLYSVHDLEDYASAISPPPADFSGFIFVETDRKYTDPKDASQDLKCWENVLEEYRYVLSLSKESKLVRGIVPWAPIHLGKAAMGRYQNLLDAVDREIYGDEKHGLLVGYRYLLQDKPRGTCLTQDFIEGLEFIRDTGRAFDLGVDVNRTGLWQFEESLQAMSKVKGLKVVINHFSKPALGREPEGGMGRWKELVGEAAGYENAVVKLSGGFSELPEGLGKDGGNLPEDKIVDLVTEYARHIFKVFGPGRIIWGSDWPVCRIGYEQIMGPQKGAWQAWLEISKKVIKQIRDEGEVRGEESDWEGIWGANAIKAYNIVS
ncbi:hypothetical protein ABW19_dt0209427 [Dactylella cylindrospora]|nr:hypothetical protein ABW19_dt0209427 [Dactylella cylindrospora]